VLGYFRKLNEPFPFSVNLKTIAGISLIFPLFFVVLQPFGVVNWQCENKVPLLLGMSVPIFLSLSVNTFVTSRLFNQALWTTGKEMLWSLWNVISIIVAVLVYFRLFSSCQYIPASTSTNLLLNGLVLGIIPGLVCLQFNKLRIARNHLNISKSTGQRPQPKQGIDKSEAITLQGDTETLQFKSSELILLEAQDNYVAVYWYSDQSLRQKLIRATMAKLENQLPVGLFKRCHRSYIINLTKVSSVSRQSRSCQLNMEYLNHPVPVSRNNIKAILDAIDELQDGPTTLQKANQSPQ